LTFEVSQVVRIVGRVVDDTSAGSPRPISESKLARGPPGRRMDRFLWCAWLREREGPAAARVQTCGRARGTENMRCDGCIRVRGTGGVRSCGRGARWKDGNCHGERDWTGMLAACGWRCNGVCDAECGWEWHCLQEGDGMPVEEEGEDEEVLVRTEDDERPARGVEETPTRRPSPSTEAASRAVCWRRRPSPPPGPQLATPSPPSPSRRCPRRCRRCCPSATSGRASR
jgi:hypothetical protein